MIQLTRREQRLTIGAVAVVAVWAVYGLAIAPVRDRIQTLKRIIPEKESELREVQATSAEYLGLRQGLRDVQSRMAQQDPNFELLSFAESMVEQHGLTTHATNMDGYLGTVVEITLEDIALKQLVDFLRAVENSDVVAQVGTLHVQKDAQNEMLLDSLVQIYSPGPDHTALATDLARP